MIAPKAFSSMRLSSSTRGLAHARRCVRPGFLVMALIGAALAASSAMASSLTVLYSFKGGTADGAQPSAGVVLGAHGALYGTTIFGGSSHAGIAFKLTPGKPNHEWTETIIHPFAGGAGDGANPNELIIDKHGALYGTAGGGGGTACSGFGCGIVFKLTPPTGSETEWSETILYPFKGGRDGADPAGGLVMDSAGALYGTTSRGGGSSVCGSINGHATGCGTFFKLTKPKSGAGEWIETVLHRYTGGKDGAVPEGAPTIDAAGNIYVSTLEGGLPVQFNAAPDDSAKGGGTISALEREKQNFIPVHDYNAGNSGYVPPIAAHACSNCEEDSYDFAPLSDPEAAAPTRHLVGVTLAGGDINGCSANGYRGCGVAYLLTRPAKGSGQWTESLLHTFTGRKDGASPYGSLLVEANVIYGTTYGRDTTTDYGTIFALTPPSKAHPRWGYKVSYRFTGSKAAYPQAGLALNGKALYGTTTSGGVANIGCDVKGCGTVYMFKP